MNSSEVVTKMIENSKAAMAPMNELAELTKRAYARNAEQQMAVVREYMEFGTKSVETLVNTKDPRELVAEQINIAKAMSEKAMANAEAFSKLAADTQAEFTGWAEKTAKTTEAAVEEAVKAA
ncbi:MAG: phasin family protein [Gammaproteobacteria bacterium]